MVESRWGVGRDPSGPTMPTIMVEEGLRVSSRRAGERGVQQVLKPDWTPKTLVIIAQPTYTICARQKCDRLIIGFSIKSVWQDSIKNLISYLNLVLDRNLEGIV